MIIVRRYKRLGWFDLLDKLSEELSENPPKERYFDFLDEFRMRLIESVSEGASYKLKVPAKDLIEKFKARQASEDGFATHEDIAHFLELAEDIL